MVSALIFQRRYRRKGFLKALDTEICRAGRFGEEICLLLIKVCFQAAGAPPDVEIKNRLLQRSSESFIRDFRKPDTYGRLDARTFALLMPKTTKTPERCTTAYPASFPSALPALPLTSNFSCINFNILGNHFAISGHCGLDRFDLFDFASGIRNRRKRNL